jgi:hypothetical protein
MPCAALCYLKGTPILIRIGLFDGTIEIVG